VSQGPFAVLVLLVFGGMLAARGRLLERARASGSQLVLAALAVDAALILLHLATGGHPLFNLNNECDLPTLWSGVQLLGVALLVDGARRSAPRGDRLGRSLWIGLAAMFAYLALDETLTIHEHVGKWLSGIWFRDFFLDYFGRAKPTPAAWVFFYLPVVAGALVGLRVFHRRCLAAAPPAGRMLFVLGAALYAAAIGMELVETRLRHAAVYRMLEVLEESFEMIGTTAFLGWVVATIRGRPGLPPSPSPVSHRNRRPA
jgi:hypothetical protein